MKLNYKYTDHGGATIVFLHGWGGDINSLDCISKNLCDYSCLTIDLSIQNYYQPQKAYEVYDYAFEVFLLLKKLNINEVIIVGHSFGGRLAIILSSICNINILATFLIDSAGICEKRKLKNKISVTSYKICKFLASHRLLKSHILDHFGSSDYKILSDMYKKIFVQIVNCDLVYLCDYIKCPVVLIWGVDDTVTPISMAYKLASHIEDSAIIKYNGGHFCYIQNSYAISKIILSVVTQ